MTDFPTVGEKVLCLYPTTSSLHDDITTWRYREAVVTEITATACDRRPARLYRLDLRIPADNGTRVEPYAASKEMLRPYDPNLIGRSPRTVRG